MISFKYKDKMYSIEIINKRKGLIFKRDKYYVCIYDNGTPTINIGKPVIEQKIGFYENVFKEFETTKIPEGETKIYNKISLYGLLHLDDVSYKNSLIDYGIDLLDTRIYFKNIRKNINERIRKV